MTANPSTGFITRRSDGKNAIDVRRERNEFVYDVGDYARRPQALTVAALRSRTAQQEKNKTAACKKTSKKRCCV